MNIVLKFRPRIQTAGTIPELRRKLRNLSAQGITFNKFTSNGIVNTRRGNENIYYAFNLEKHNRKTKAIGVNRQKLKKRQIVKKSFARAYVYTFTESDLIAMKKKIVQSNRTFKLVDM